MVLRDASASKNGAAKNIKIMKMQNNVLFGKRGIGDNALGLRQVP